MLNGLWKEFQKGWEEVLCCMVERQQTMKDWFMFMIVTMNFVS